MSIHGTIVDRLREEMGESYLDHSYPRCEKWTEQLRKIQSELGCFECKDAPASCEHYSEDDPYCLRRVREKRHAHRIDCLRLAGFGDVHLRAIERHDVQDWPCLHAVREFGKRDEHIRFLILAGPRGVGKTFGGALVSYGHEESLLVKVLRIQQGGLFGPGSELLNRARDVECLVLDDLGVEYLEDKGIMMSILHDLIDARYEHSGPTVITTNMNLEAMAKRYSPAIIRRLKETGMYRWIGSKEGTS